MDFEQLRVWQGARELTKLIYDLSSEGPFARDFGLRDQMRRAAVSIMSNIAEGAESRTNRLFVDYLGRAKASAGELRAQIVIAGDQGYLDGEAVADARQRVMTIARQLFKLMQYLESAPQNTGTKETMADYVAIDVPSETLSS